MTVAVTGGAASCNGSLIGRCAGSRLAWIRDGGKDLIDSVKLGRDMPGARRAATGRLQLRAFLDEKGQKISKVEGNGLTITNGCVTLRRSRSPLSWYREPKAAKRLYFDVPAHGRRVPAIPRRLFAPDQRQQVSNPVWHIHSGNPLRTEMPISVLVLLTLVSSSNARNAETMGLHRRYPGRHAADPSEANDQVQIRAALLPRLCVAGQEIPQADRSRACGAVRLRDALSQLPAAATAEDIQNVVYERRPPRAVSRFRRRRQRTASRRVARLVQHALPGASGRRKARASARFVAVYGIQSTSR